MQPVANAVDPRNLRAVGTLAIAGGIAVALAPAVDAMYAFVILPLSLPYTLAFGLVVCAAAGNVPLGIAAVVLGVLAMRGKVHGAALGFVGIVALIGTVFLLGGPTAFLGGALILVAAVVAHQAPRRLGSDSAHAAK